MSKPHPIAVRELLDSIATQTEAHRVALDHLLVTSHDDIGLDRLLSEMSDTIATLRWLKTLPDDKLLTLIKEQPEPQGVCTGVGC